jgi:hypothetical protein
MWKGTADTLKAKPTSSRPTAFSRHVAADAIEARAAGQRVRQRDPIEKESTREGAEQEVLEGPFGARRIVAPHAGEHVDRQRENLQGQEDEQQVGCDRHDHHAGNRKQRDRVVLTGGQVLSLDRGTRERNREHADDDERGRDEQAEIVGL